MNIINKLFFSGNDLTVYFLPDVVFFREALLKFKQIPFWNPKYFLGLSYILDPQNLIFYPPSYLLLLFSPLMGIAVVYLLHLIWGLFWLNKTLISSKLKVILLIFYAASPKLALHLYEGHWTLVLAYFWLPPLYYALKNKKSLLLIISLSALAYLYLNIFIYAILFVVLFSICNRYSPKYYIRNILYPILISFPRWLPLLLYRSLTTRSGIEILPVWNFKKLLASTFFPYPFNFLQLQPEEIIYPSLIFLGLALLALFKLKNKAGRKFWLIWFIFSGLTVLKVFSFLPILNQLRVSTRILIFLPLAFTQIINQFLAHRTSHIVRILIFLGIFEILIFGYWVFQRPRPDADILPPTAYQYLSQDSSHFRVYCTTGCLDRYQAQKHNLLILTGNNPIQLDSFTNFLARAGGYSPQPYVTILPPYTAFDSQPQPNAQLMAQANTKYLFSPYLLTDPNFSLIQEFAEFKLYKNQSLSKPSYTITKYTPNYIDLEINQDQLGEIVFPEQYFPGWYATGPQGNKQAVQPHHQVFRSFIADIPGSYHLIYSPISLILNTKY